MFSRHPNVAFAVGLFLGMFVYNAIVHNDPVRGFVIGMIAFVLYGGIMNVLRRSRG